MSCCAALEVMTKERDNLLDAQSKSLQTIGKLTAERDAAFAMSKCECESNEACKNLVALHDEVERLKSALCEAKEALLRLGGWLEARRMGGLTPDENQTIATINAALGSE